jgi:hypothetical protein
VSDRSGRASVKPRPVHGARTTAPGTRASSRDIQPHRGRAQPGVTEMTGTQRAQK